jgi:hypothetical protein
MAKKAFYKTEKFKKLEAEWYGKLKAEGFDDIEGGNNSEVIEPQIFNTKPVQHLSGPEWEAESQAILARYNFKDEGQRRAFELFARGYSVREISKLLLDKFGLDIPKSKVHRVITKVRVDFKENY